MNTLGTKFILADQYVFDPNSNTLFDRNCEESVRLGSNESRILLMFVLHQSEVIKRDELHDFVWRQQGFEVDDSSLTQAISTLRKVLNDSTKTPLFIKTVPKRGYQFISTVEKTTDSKGTIQSKQKDADIDSDMTPTHSDEADVASVENIKLTENTTSINDDTSLRHLEINGKENTLKKWPVSVNVCLIFTLVVPIIAFMSGKPTMTKFNELAVYNDVRIETPMNNPKMEQWVPTIKLCLNKYKERYPNQSLPIRLIATGGIEDKLTLNYIFSRKDEERNVTLSILANQSEISKVCR